MLAGLDGCNKGWMACIQQENHCEFSWFSSIDDFLKKYPDITYVGIDIVIGLPEQAQKGGRLSEQQARKYLGKRGSSVFSAPCRSAVYAKSYKDALQQSRESSPDQIGLSKQTYNIIPLIKDVDITLRNNPDLIPKFFEVHPELSFWEMNDRNPLASKHTKEGYNTRRELLLQKKTLHSHKEFLSKDHLDSAACLWSIERISNGNGCRVPTTERKDSFNLPMTINW